MTIKHAKGNTYYIETDLCLLPFYKINDKDVVMMDSGWAKEGEGILALLRQHNLRVVGLICTHSHIDHIGNNGLLKKNFQTVIALPTVEAIICSTVSTVRAIFINLSLKDINEFYGEIIGNTDIYINDDASGLEMFGVHFKIVHIPGHSPAQIAVITPDNVMYVGDGLISDSEMKNSKLPFATTLEQDLASKMKLKQIPCDLYIMTHRAITDDIQTIVDKNIAFYKNRADTVASVITKPMTNDEIIKEVIEKFEMHRNMNIRKYRLIERNLKAFIEYLVEHDVIRLEIQNNMAYYIPNK